MQQTDIFSKIRSYSYNGSPQKSRIAQFLLKSHQKAALMSATQLSRQIGISQPTLTRFVQKLGFNKYRDFQIAFQDILVNDLTTAERFTLELKNCKSDQVIASSTLYNEIKSLSFFLNNFPSTEMTVFLKRINKSENIVVIGTGISGIIAQHIAYYISRVKRNVSCLQNASFKSYEKLSQLGKKDTVIAISTYRYSRETIELLKFCKKIDVNTLGITDSVTSPLSTLSETCIIVPISSGKIFDATCSIFCLSIIIATRLVSLNKSESRTLLEEHETLAMQTKLYTDDKRTI